MTQYYLIKKNGEVIEFRFFADLLNAFKSEYGFFPTIAKVIEGQSRNQLFYW